MCNSRKRLVPSRLHLSHMSQNFCLFHMSDLSILNSIFFAHISRWEETQQTLAPTAAAARRMFGARSREPPPVREPPVIALVIERRSIQRGQPLSLCAEGGAEIVGSGSLASVADLAICFGLVN